MVQRRTICMMLQGCQWLLLSRFVHSIESIGTYSSHHLGLTVHNLQIYGDLRASSKDCFRMFNPVDITSFNVSQNLFHSIDLLWIRVRHFLKLHLQSTTSRWQRVLNDWSAAFFTMFSIGVQQMDGLQSKAIPSGFDHWVSIDDYLNGYLMHRKSRYGKKLEVLELGLQEIRTYFRLFLLSSVLLLFMFCSRISKSTRPLVSAMSLWLPK